MHTQNKKQMEQLADYQLKRIQALEAENARLANLLEESKVILSQLLKDLENGSI